MARMIYSAPTAEEALQRAADELKLPADALELEILEDATDDGDIEEDEGICIRVRVKGDFAAQQAKELLIGLLDKMRIEGQVEVRTANNVINISILGPDSSLLIGRDGSTLDSIQHWLTRGVAKIIYSSPRLLVDVENYRQRKFDKLRDMARKMGRRVAQKGRAERLSAMGPVERKFIHNSLKDIEGVMTYSIGREGRRHVVIAPSEDAEKQARDFEDEPAPPGEQSRKRPRDQKKKEKRPEDDVISSASAFSSLKVIATPENVDSGDEIEDELDESLFSPNDIVRRPHLEDLDEELE